MYLHTPFRLGSWLLIIVGISCGTSGPHRGRLVRVHPIADFEAKPVAISESLRIHSGGASGRSRFTFEDANGPRRWTRRGGWDGRLEEALGSLDAALATKAKELLVLDRRQNRIHVIGWSGEALPDLAGPGQELGQLWLPLAIAMDASQRVYVADGRLRIQRYSRRGDAWIFESSFVVPLPPRAMCVIDSMLFLQVLDGHTPAPIHAYTLSGRVLRKFGPSYSSAVPEINAMSLTGLLACSPEHGFLAYMPSRLFGAVYVYSTDGRPLREVRLTDYHGMRAEEYSGGGVLLGLRPDRTDEAASLHVLPSGALVLQVRMVAAHPAGAFNSESERILTFEEGLDHTFHEVASVPEILAIAGTSIVAREDSVAPSLAWTQGN